MTPRTRAIALEWLHNKLGDVEESIAQSSTRPADEDDEQRQSNDLAQLDMQRERLVIKEICDLVQAVPS